ncbi:MAG: helix-turn-helix transcriptional regulator [Atopobiaceae bacterium]|nr:helix-turn-helix transcriptional regulator [Atopobiaceae bacterium]
MKKASYDTVSVGNRLKSGMADQGINAEQLAEMTGLSVYSIRAWMRGSSSMTLDSATKVCDALGWPIDRLMRRE